MEENRTGRELNGEALEQTAGGKPTIGRYNNYVRCIHCWGETRVVNQPEGETYNGTCSHCGERLSAKVRSY